MQLFNLIPTLLLLTSTSLSFTAAEANPYDAPYERFQPARRHADPYADPRDLIGGMAAEMGAEILANTHPRYRDCLNQQGEFAKRDGGFVRRDPRGGGGRGGRVGKKGKKSGSVMECAKYLKG
ncbi:hypothetical protein MMC13_002781 [Lambiella insularis]|nr:hypothetical protein [Lambiella insularis]